MFYPGFSAVLLYCVELLDKEKLDCICVVVLSCTSLARHTSGVVLGLTVVTNFGGHPRPGPWSHHHHCHPHRHQRRHPLAEEAQREDRDGEGPPSLGGGHQQARPRQAGLSKRPVSLGTKRSVGQRE